LLSAFPVIDKEQEVTAKNVEQVLLKHTKINDGYSWRTAKKRLILVQQTVRQRYRYPAVDRGTLIQVELSSDDNK
jgi:hypothetical protein